MRSVLYKGGGAALRTDCVGDATRVRHGSCRDDAQDSRAVSTRDKATQITGENQEKRHGRDCRRNLRRVFPRRTDRDKESYCAAYERRARRLVACSSRSPMDGMDSRKEKNKSETIMCWCRSLGDSIHACDSNLKGKMTCA